MTLTTDAVSTWIAVQRLSHSAPEVRNDRTLTHTDSLLKLAFSPDSQLLATGGRSIHLWEVASGQPRGTLPARNERLCQMTFTGNATLAAVWSGGTVEEWQFGDVPACRHTLELPEHTLYDVVAVPGGRLLAVHATPDGHTLAITEVRSGTEIAAFAMPEPVTTARFTPDGQQLLAFTTLGLMRLWNATEGVLCAEVVAKLSAEVLYLGVSHDGLLIATRMRNGSSVQVWDTASGKAVGPALPIVQAHEAVFSPDNRLLAISSTRPQAGIELRDLPSGDLRHTLAGSYPAAFSPNGAFLACGSAAAGQSTAAVVFRPGPTPESDLHAQPDQPLTAATAAQVGLLAILRGHSLPVRCVALSPDGRLVASGSADKTVRLWDTASGTVQAILRAYRAPINALVFSPDGRRLIAASGDPGSTTDPSVRIFALDSADGAGAVVETLHFARHHHCVTSVDVRPDGTQIASTDCAGHLLLWDAHSGEVQHDIAHAAPVNDVAFSPDSRWVATAVGGETERGYWDTDNSVRLWDVTSGELYAVLKRHKDWVLRAVFSPDGHVAAAIDQRQRLVGWEIDSQRVVLDQTGSTAIALTHSDDLAAVAQGNTIQLMNPKTGEPLAELRGHTARVNQIAFSADNRLLASASDDGTVRLWGVPQPGQEVVIVTDPAVADSAQEIATTPTVFTLRLIELTCRRGQERDGDEVYLKLNGRTIWDVQRFGRRMRQHLQGEAICTDFNFRDCTCDAPEGRVVADPYRPDDFILGGLTTPAVLQLWEADSFLRGGDDLLGEVTLDASAARWDEVEWDFDRVGAHYRLRFAILLDE